MVIAPHGLLSEEVMADSMYSCHPFGQTDPNLPLYVPPHLDAPVDLLEDAQARALRDVLQQCHGNRKESARQLGIGRATLWRKMKKYGLLEANSPS